jgi:hypothetical protein
MDLRANNRLLRTAYRCHRAVLGRDMKEKEEIEKATVDAFVQLHNEMHGTSYSVREYGDQDGKRPDAVCVTADGDHFNVEVTITEDRPGDIRWALGRADQRPYQGAPGSCLQGNVLAQLAVRLDKKSIMRYGCQTALVIRDSSGVDWDWEDIRPQAEEYLRQRGNPFQFGIWIVNRAKTRLHRIA